MREVRVVKAFDSGPRAALHSTAAAPLLLLQRHGRRFSGPKRASRPTFVSSSPVVPPTSLPPPCTVSTIEGMSLDVKASKSDLVARLHLDAVTVQDMARPSDSPFRHMMYTMPDETSQHGGLVHVTYWESAGGVRRIPPSGIADTNGERYDQVLDARVSTLQVRRPPSLKGRIERVVCDPAQVLWPAVG